MKENPKFSVVIPMFNALEFVERAVASVMQQSVQASEIIIVDDGSTDGASTGLRNRFPDITILTQENCGVGLARNAGIKASSSDWIAFLDADDFWFPNHLEVVSRVIRTFPRASVISTGVKEWMPGTPMDIRHRKVRISLIDYFQQRTVNPGVINSSTAVVNRKALEIVGDFKPIKIGEDLDMWERLALRFTFAHATEITSVYVQHQSGSMAQFARELRTVSDLKQQKFYESQNLTGDSATADRKTLQRYKNSLIYTNVKSLLQANQITSAKIEARKIEGATKTKQRIALFFVSRAPVLFVQIVVRIKS